MVVFERMFQAMAKVINTQQTALQSLMDLLIGLRATARKDKNFALADRIRDELAAIAIVLEDTPCGTIWLKE